MVEDQYYDRAFNQQSWKRWRHKYDNQIHTPDDGYKAIETMLASLEYPGAEFRRPREVSERESYRAAALLGLSLRRMQLNKTFVDAVSEHSPAEAAGVRPGDEVRAINGKDVNNTPFADIFRESGGATGSQFSLLLMRQGRPFTVSLTRGMDWRETNQPAKLLDASIGYLRLKTVFNGNLVKRIESALATLPEANGLIVDVRDNDGGTMEFGVQLSRLFLDHGIITSIMSRDGYLTTREARNNAVWSKPLVMLVDSHTAAGAELLVAALRDNNRCSVIGQTTAGDNWIREPAYLEDGCAVNVAVAKWLTPNNISITRQGIVPDAQTKLSTEQIDAGFGPWWDYPNSGTPPTSALKDIQLKQALATMQAVLNKETVRSKEIPPSATGPTQKEDAASDNISRPGPFNAIRKKLQDTQQGPEHNSAPSKIYDIY